MKIVYIVKSIAQLGGLDRVLTDKMNYLSEIKDHEILLITYEQGTHHISYPISNRIKHIDLKIRFFTLCNKPIWKRLFMYLSMKFDFKKELKTHIQNFQPDILICMTDSFPLLDIILQIPGNHKKIVENHVDKCDYMKAPHYEQNKFLYPFLWLFDQYIIRQIKKCDKFVVLTRADYNDWKKCIQNIELIPNPITYIPNDISLLDAKKIISVGRLTHQKGYDLLIESWSIVSKKHPDWELYIYGDGSDRLVLESSINQKKLSNIYLCKATHDIYNKYLDSSIFVMSSRYEGFGLVLIEAMSCGLPCISFDCPSGPAEIITHEYNGIIVENGNINKLADGICYLIENEVIRKEMGKNAKNSIFRYKKENIMSLWDNLFCNLN